MPKQVQVDIGTDGKIDATVLGVEGPSCMTDLNFLDGLGKVVSDCKTADYEKEPRLENREQAREGR